MARGRMISKALSTSKKFAVAGRSPLGEFAQLVYALLLPHADDFGRQEGDPFTVKHKVLPSSTRGEDDFVAALCVLRDAGLILWYDSPEGQVIEIVGFDAHQSGLHKRTASRFPGISGKFPDFPENSRLTELNRTEGKGSERKAPALAGTLPRDHVDHAFCGSRFCVSAKHVSDMARRYGQDGDAAVLAWLQSLNDSLPEDKSAGGALWVLQQFDAWLVASGRIAAPPTKADVAAQKRAELRARIIAGGKA